MLNVTSLRNSPSCSLDIGMLPGFIDADIVMMSMYGKA